MPTETQRSNAKTAILTIVQASVTCGLLLATVAGCSEKKPAGPADGTEPSIDADRSSDSGASGGSATGADVAPGASSSSEK